MFDSIVGAIEKVVKGIRKVPITTLIVDIIGFIPGIVRDIENILSLGKDGVSKEELKTMIDEALLSFDLRTGEDGYTVIPGMTKEKQEETLDSLAKVIKNILYAKLGLPGYSDSAIEE